MKQTKLALSAVMIVAVGLIGTNFVTGSEMIGQEKFDALSNSNAVYGHLTIVHSDPDGNILSYIQTDNEVAAIGLDCMAALVFGGTAGDNCEGNKTATFSTIGLFKDESFPNTMNATVVGGQDLFDTILTTNGLEIENGTATPTTDSDANPTSGGIGINPGSKTDIEVTFTVGSKVSGQVVNGAALFNTPLPVQSPFSNAVLAGQTFADVTLDSEDTLTITWTIEIG